VADVLIDTDILVDVGRGMAEARVFLEALESRATPWG
jgi:hypothetical protein